jgi:hypothetical protein
MLATQPLVLLVGAALGAAAYVTEPLLARYGMLRPPCCLFEGPGVVVGVLLDGLVLPVKDGAERWRAYLV